MHYARDLRLPRCRRCSEVRLTSHSIKSAVLMLCRSGIMRLTVTVVVIMFELTGALTYILPTMVLLICLVVRLTCSHCAS